MRCYVRSAAFIFYASPLCLCGKTRFPVVSSSDAGLPSLEYPATLYPGLSPLPGTTRRAAEAGLGAGVGAWGFLHSADAGASQHHSAPTRRWLADDAAC